MSATTGAGHTRRPASGTPNSDSGTREEGDPNGYQRGRRTQHKWLR
ncbi:hypothetical protein [Streptomyces sp. NBC_01462]|nr:hypothetical protein [Streptomyces sp. NBC_01462]